jgi:hypothetical protein
VVEELAAVQGNAVFGLQEPELLGLMGGGADLGHRDGHRCLSDEGQQIGVFYALDLRRVSLDQA